jgi:aminoglycoside phosphotransferase family enzyme
MPADPPALDAKVAYLRSLCGRGDEVIETHFAWLFLIGDRAWKLRKPVCRDTMDYRSLEARRSDSLEEVGLNRRLAPDIYLGAVPLVRDAEGSLRIGGEGEVVDWLVGMRRLDRSRLLEARLSQSSVDAGTLHAVALRLATFYRSAEPAITDSRLHIERLLRQIEANRTALHSLPIEGADEVRDRLRDFVTQRTALLAPRAPSGCVVEAHGDLRPEHVFLGDPPEIIDCLEFDRDLRVLDRAEELSFLELECARLGHATEGRTLARGCLALLGDRAPDTLLAFYRSHRGATRAKLYAWRASERDGGRPEDWIARASSYVANARKDAAIALG